MADFGTGFRFYRKTLGRRLGTWLTSMGLVMERTDKSESFDALMQRRLNATKLDGQGFFFVQIGANDGVSHDPIHGFVTANRLPGIVVEPLPDAFQKLQQTYQNHSQIRALNLAVHRELDQVTLYRPNPETAGALSGIASFSADRHELTSKRSGLTADDMVAVEVPAKSLMAILEGAQVPHLDLLQIDTEGYDFEILASLDLERYQPSIIRFEHGVYSGVDARPELRDALTRLYDHGYSIAMERVDAMAWRHADISKRK